MKSQKSSSGNVHSLSDDDLNAIELNLVSIIRKHIKLAVIGTEHQKKQSMLWLYEDKYQLGSPSLRECCHVLNLPYELVRIRMQFELYKENVTFSNLKCDLPIVLSEEIIYHYNKDVAVSALYIWQNPGVVVNEVGPHFINSRVLIERNIVVMNHHEQLWMTCRNPNLNHNIHWTKCWSFYD